MKKIDCGYYIKARKVKYSWIANASPCIRETWDYLLREACFQEEQYNGYTLKRGQLFRKYSQIREDLHWMSGYRKETYSGDAMKRAMKTLMEHGMVSLTKAPRGNLITVLKYDLYQDPENYGRTNGRSNDTPTAHQRRTNGALSIKEEPKNLRTKERESGSNSLSPGLQLLREEEQEGRELYGFMKEQVTALTEEEFSFIQDIQEKWQQAEKKYPRALHKRFKEEEMHIIHLFIWREIQGEKREGLMAVYQSLVKCLYENNWFRSKVNTPQQFIGSARRMIQETYKAV